MDAVRIYYKVAGEAPRICPRLLHFGIKVKLLPKEQISFKQWK